MNPSRTVGGTGMPTTTHSGHSGGGRVVFLVDMNAFFISCEMTRKPELTGVPAAVAGDPAYRAGIILAANYEARRFGVRTTMVLHEARRLCPQLVLVPPDHHFYEAKSVEVMDLLSRYSPLVEPNSIDEAWLDMTGCEGLSGPPLVAAEAIMGEIRESLGLWCSIGIAENKYLAKMAADMKKPMGITELWPSMIREKMWPLPVGDLLGVGRKSAERLQRYGLRTIGDVAAMDPEILGKWFGRGGGDIWRHAHGLDDSPVTPPVGDDMKSIGRSTTLPQDITDLETARTVLMQLGEEVCAALRRYGKRARVVRISLKYADFTSVTRQAALAPTQETAPILQTGFRLLQDNWNVRKPVRLLGISVSGFEEADQMSLFDLPQTGAVGGNTSPLLPQQAAGAPVQTSNGERAGGEVEHVCEIQEDGDVEPVHEIQEAKPPPKQPVRERREQEARNRALDATLDHLRERYGTDAVQRARLLGLEKPKRHGGNTPNHKSD